VKKLLFWLMARAGGELGAFRAAILLAYLATTALVQVLCTRVTSARWVGLGSAGCFALNPTALGVAAWLSASNLVLGLLALLAYLLCAERALDAPRSGRRQALVLVPALFALALSVLCHQLALLAPLLLVAYRRALGRPRGEGALAVYVGSLVVVAACLALQLSAGRPAVSYRFAETPAWLLTWSAARYMAQNALIWLWPRDHFGVLLVDDPSRRLVASGLCWIGLAVACALSWKYRRRVPHVVFGLFWLGSLLAPVANLVPLGNTPLAAHYVFMPSVGLALALCGGSALLLRRLPAQGARPRAAGAVVLAAALLAAWLPDARRIVSAWGEPERLFLISHQNYPDNVELLANLAAIRLSAGDFAAAERFLLRAERVAPGDVNVLRNRYSLLWQTSRFTDALRLLDTHPELAGDAEFAVRRGEVLEALERWEDAARAFERAFALAEQAGAKEVRYVAGVRLVTAWVRIEQRQRAEQLTRRLLAEYPGRQEIAAIAQILERVRNGNR
jgi:tetratricopeptide (TPR) repeat protein